MFQEPLKRKHQLVAIRQEFRKTNKDSLDHSEDDGAVEHSFDLTWHSTSENLVGSSLTDDASLFDFTSTKVCKEHVTLAG